MLPPKSSGFFCGAGIFHLFTEFCENLLSSLSIILPPNEHTNKQQTNADENIIFLAFLQPLFIWT